MSKTDDLLGEILRAVQDNSPEDTVSIHEDSLVNLAMGIGALYKRVQTAVYRPQEPR